MKNTQFISIILLILLGIGSTHYLIAKIPEKITAKMLAIEYDKVGGMENYVELNKINKQQVISGLKAYKAQNGEIPIVDENNGNNDNLKNNSEDSNNTILKKVITENVYIKGNPDAEITWVEYSDMNCHYCKKLHNSGTADEILKAYDGKVNIISKQFPIFAPEKAAANLCAGKIAGSDKYYTYIDKMFNGDYNSTSDYIKLAEELDIDIVKFESCLKSDEIKKLAQSQMDEGKNLFGITGTPGNVLINNKTGKWDKLPGAYPTAAFKEKIDNLLK